VTDRVPGRRRHGLGDPRLAWNVLLRARLDDPPDPAAVAHRLAGVGREVPWPVVTVAPAARGLAALAEIPAAGASVAVAGTAVSVRAAHQDLDGLGLLVLLGRVLDRPLRSSARGVGQRPAQGSLAATALRRLAEVALAPQARVARSPARGVHGAPGEAFVARTVDDDVDVARLVVATVDAVRDWNERHRRPARRVTVAVGVATVAGDEAGLRDQSAFLRLRHAELLDVDGVRTGLRQAPVQRGGGPDRPGPVLGSLLGLGTRLLAGRLGSTVLVSHLGRVDAAGVQSLEFYPVSGGGSGRSVGAATVAGRTTVTLRARAGRHAAEALKVLLEGLVDRLRTTPNG
jgi:hypothetical protein